MFKRFSTLVSTLRGIGDLRQHLDRLPHELAQKRVTAHSGGGMVEVEVNGNLELVRLKIAPELAGRGDHEILEDLVLAAVHEGMRKARDLAAQTMTEAVMNVSPQQLGEMAQSMMSPGESMSSLFESVFGEAAGGQSGAEAETDQTADEEATDSREADSREGANPPQPEDSIDPAPSSPGPDGPQ